MINLFLQINIARLASLISQWYFGPDIKLAFNFVAREYLAPSYGLALFVNLFGALSLYFPIRFAPAIYHVLLQILPLNWALGLVYVVKELKKWAHSAWNKIQEINGKFRGPNLDSTRKNNHQAVSDFIRESRFIYLTTFGLNLFPIPIIGAALTAGCFLFIRTTKLKFGLTLVLLAKATKVTAIAACCYMYQPVASGLSLIISFIAPINPVWAPIWAYCLSAYAPTLIVVLAYTTFLIKFQLKFR